MGLTASQRASETGLGLAVKAMKSSTVCILPPAPLHACPLLQACGAILYAPKCRKSFSKGFFFSSENRKWSCICSDHSENPPVSFDLDCEQQNHYQAFTWVTKTSINASLGGLQRRAAWMGENQEAEKFDVESSEHSRGLRLLILDLTVNEPLTYHFKKQHSLWLCCWNPKDTALA